MSRYVITMYYGSRYVEPDLQPMYQPGRVTRPPANAKFISSGVRGERGLVGTCI